MNIYIYTTYIYIYIYIKREKCEGILTKIFPPVWIEIFSWIDGWIAVFLYLQPMAFSVKSEGFSRRDSREDSESVVFGVEETQKN